MTAVVVLSVSNNVETEKEGLVGWVLEEETANYHRTGSYSYTSLF